jgi:ectoine hydroxylase-related dioxygenase (phytanoyl-CoA dioxygenase family)
MKRANVITKADSLELVREDGMVAAELRGQLQAEGFCIVEGVLQGEKLARARNGLDAAVERNRAKGGIVHDGRLDPNAANIRVYNLPAVDPVFIELLREPQAIALAEEVLGPNLLVSNFTANIALPGSGSMRLHSDQALVIPAPWHAPWAMNVIWCLDDVRAENGATRYLPGSHRYTDFEELPADAEAKTVAFEAPAGSIIAMEGRLWHTSGANVTVAEQRRMMFAYYSTDFIRPQMNWEAILPPAVKDSLDGEGRALFGLGPAANTRIGGELTRLTRADAGRS